MIRGFKLERAGLALAGHGSKAPPDNGYKFSHMSYTGLYCTPKRNRNMLSIDRPIEFGKVCRKSSGID